QAPLETFLQPAEEVREQPQEQHGRSGSYVPAPGPTRVPQVRPSQPPSSSILEAPASAPREPLTATSLSAAAQREGLVPKLIAQPIYSRMRGGAGGGAHAPPAPCVMHGAHGALSPPAPAPRLGPSFVAPAPAYPQPGQASQVARMPSGVRSASPAPQPGFVYRCPSTDALPRNHFGAGRPGARPMPRSPALISREQTEEEPSALPGVHLCGSSSPAWGMGVPEPLSESSPSHAFSEADPLQVGKPIRSWTEEHVAQWLMKLSTVPVDLLDIVHQHAITGAVLLSLTEQDLETLHLEKFGHRRLLMLAARELRRAAQAERLPGEKFIPSPSSSMGSGAHPAFSVSVPQGAWHRSAPCLFFPALISVQSPVLDSYSREMRGGDAL
ncbi:unnamed protein product, partial [Effrenium voratum]